MQERLIRHIRESLNMTQQEFAAALEISQATVSRWEAGRVSPDVEMRRRIHDLARRDGGMIDAPLFALVRRAPSNMVLMDMDMRFLALSDAASQLHRMTPREASGVNYRPYFTADMETAYETALQAGFFTGEGLSVDLCCELLTLQGETVHMRGSWHILPRPSTGQPLLVWHGQNITAAEYQAQKATQGVVRIISLTEWLEDDMHKGLPQTAQGSAVA